MTAIPHYDVIIIGAGSIGTPTAFYLAQAGFKVLVIDRVPSVGQGSNKKAIGGIRATHSDPAKIRMCLRSIEVFSTWQQTYGDNIEWYQGGYCFVAYREREEKILKDLLSRQKSLGLNIDWLDRATLLERIPDLNPNDLIGGTYSPEDGNASPQLANHAIYDHAVRLGARFCFNESITEVIQQSGKVVGIKTDKGQYGADVVLNAAGAWAHEVGLLAGLDLPVQPDSHEAAITEPVQRFFDPLIVDIRPVSGSSNFYFYQHFTGQIIFCVTPEPPIWGYDDRETSSFLPLAASRIVEVMPRLKNIRVRRTWRGLYPMTPDGNPILGWAPNLQGYLLAVGLCGQGFMLGPGMAELLVRLLQNNLTSSDQEILAALSPTRSFANKEMLK